MFLCVSVFCVGASCMRSTVMVFTCLDLQTANELKRYPNE